MIETAVERPEERRRRRQARRPRVDRELHWIREAIAQRWRDLEDPMDWVELAYLQALYDERQLEGARR